LVEAEGSHPFRFCTQPRIHRIPNCDLHQDALLETAAYRSAPMDCGPNVDKARPSKSTTWWDAYGATKDNMRPAAWPIARRGAGAPVRERIT
jgi:hypothetical protein